MADFRLCPKCEQSKPLTLEHFGSHKTRGWATYCRPCKKRYEAEYYAKHFDHGRKVRRAYYQATPVEVRQQRSRDWRAKNPTKNAEFVAAWREANRETALAQRRAHEATRRARKKAATGQFSPTDIDRLLAAQRRRCWWCSSALTDYHIDHRVPLSKGGANDVRNIVISCPHCNLSKADKMPWDFAGRLF